MRQKKQAKMYSLVEEWQGSQQTKQAFCKAYQLNPTTFHCWIQKYNKYILSEGQDLTVAKATPFIPLSIRDSSRGIAENKKSQHIDIELNYPNGVHVRLTGLVSIPYLSELIKLSI